ncbi:urease accessory protein UreE [Sporomusa acidovorans]|uniref:Urease accessory protein UreE n=1 Tax=Sporomusa acidovorans (strain ATCC 49682 / DSM 3132 / Mol) TaxID=1123286 RepID=A0ABZ3J9P0_SPOA4|nr:urease accessory protein UreE [Sporomusa acidovorans]OZC16231.1 urease accessory protein UreE [Sporomusa acidovorans DSM 3132]SDE32036.1 urease accessory protein [Sporomusa acidovorans]
MIVEKIIGTLSDSDYKNITVDYVDFAWYEAFKRLHRKVSRAGRELALRFDDSILVKGLKQDDVLAVETNTVVAVNLLPCSVLVITVKGHHEMAKACYEIGNKHAPLFYGENHDELITPYDKTIENLMQKLHIETRTAQVKLDFVKSISTGGPHTHTH